MGLEIKVTMSDTQENIDEVPRPTVVAPGSIAGEGGQVSDDSVENVQVRVSTPPPLPPSPLEARPGHIEDETKEGESGVSGVSGESGVSGDEQVKTTEIFKSCYVALEDIVAADGPPQAITLFFFISKVIHLVETTATLDGEAKRCLALALIREVVSHAHYEGDIERQVMLELVNKTAASSIDALISVATGETDLGKLRRDVSVVSCGCFGR